MSANVQNPGDDRLFDDGEFASALLASISPSPCELLEPVMRGVMARELADMALPERGKMPDRRERRGCE